MKTFQDLKTAVIELRKDTRRSDPIRGTSYPLNPGGFEVYVGGVRWGNIGTVSHGSNGLEYTLAQFTGGRLRNCSYEVPTTVNPRLNGGRTTRTVGFTTWSDKVYLRKLPSNMKPVPLADRLVALVRDAIDKGAFCDPATLAKEAETAARLQRLNEAAELQAKNKLWLAKAADALGPYAHGMAAPVVADLKARIVEAMKWAQSQ